MTGGSVAAGVLRYAAFTTDPAAGNPAGVLLDAAGLDDAAMQAVAAEVGYSETAFVVADEGRGRYRVRYFTPAAEVPFCGHATIATAMALAERGAPGELVFAVPAGDVRVHTGELDGVPAATLTSVAPYVEYVGEDVLTDCLVALRWDVGDLDRALPPRIAYAGGRHLILAAATRRRLADLNYDYEGLAAAMRGAQLMTVQLVWRADPLTHHLRVPAPAVGVAEDPATGSGAAAYGAYLRELGLIETPVRLTLHQGEDLGRPSLLLVDVPAGAGAPVSVTGTAVPITG